MKLKNIFKKQNQKVTDQPKAKVGKVDSQVKLDTDKNSKLKSEKNQPRTQKKQSDFKGLSNKVLIKPLVTEKGSVQAELGKYLFMVDKRANKIMVAKSIEETYGVKVAKVNILNYTGKRVRYGRLQGKRKDWKKAVITLKKGETIDVYKGV